tara:strand:+ start:1549 stop:2625 length:1077 start_codon:yes stop_codon:yes gene_type:complete
MNPIKATIKVQAPARICFFGDHQDYLGLPVIAGTINRYIQIKAKPNLKSKYFIQLIDLNKEITINLDYNFNSILTEDYFRSSMAVLRDEGAEFLQGFTVEISGDVPVNAGVSSSSALVVAWIRFLLQAQEATWNATDKQIGEWAYKAEVQYFDQPGGLMDQYTIAQGGLIYIDTQSGKTTNLTPKIGTLILAESGIPKKTLSILQNARNYAQNAIEEVQNKHPEFDLKKAQEQDFENYLPLVSKAFQPYWYAAIHNYLITQKSKQEMMTSDPNFEKIGFFMNAHQKILQECIQNTPNQMIKGMEAARKAGALGAKVIGSGGGGCMVALTNKHSKENVIKAFKKAGAVQAYQVQLVSNK